MKLIKAIVACGIVLLSSGITRAQNVNVRESSISYGKISPSAVVAEYDVPASMVEDAIKQYMDKAGMERKKTEKGFMIYKGVIWKEIGPDKVDVYIKVDGKGNKSTVAVLYSKGYDNFISGSTDPEKVNAIKNFLTNFVTELRRYQLMQDIARQEDVVKKAEKEYGNSVDDGKQLAEEKAKIEKKIADNTSDQANKQKTVEIEKKKLEELKAKLN